jgi:hypothetical protein
MTVRVEDKKTIWNKPIPLRPFAYVTLAIIAPLFLWVTVGDRVSDWIWYAQHHGTANYEGTLIKLPFPWRQEDTLRGEHELLLRRASRSFGMIDESIMISQGKSSPNSVRERIERFRDVMLASRPSRQTTVETYSADPFVDSNYDCISSRTPTPEEIQLFCVSADGQWNLILTWDKEASLADAVKILHQLPISSKASGS